MDSLTMVIRVKVPPRLDYSSDDKGVLLAKWAKTVAGKKFIINLDDTNPKSSDAVTKRCIINDKKCKLNKKCDTCTKEINDLQKIDAVLVGNVKNLINELNDDDTK